MADLQELRLALQKGFYVDNLKEIARFCRMAALDTKSPTPFFVVERIVSRVRENWEDRPLSVDEARFIESSLSTPIKAIVEGVDASASEGEMLGLLDAAVFAYMGVRQAYFD